MPSYEDYINGLSLDTVGGSEKVGVVDGSTPGYVTIDTILTYELAQRVAATVKTPADADEFHGDSAGTAYVYTMSAVGDYAIARLFTAASQVTPVVAGDDFVIDRGGTKYKVDIDVLATYINDGNLDLSALTAGTPGSTDLILYGSGANPRKITLSNFESQLWTDFATYVAGLTENTTVTDNDKFYVIQSGTAKWVDADTLGSYFEVTNGDTIAPVTTTENKIPQWAADQKTLSDGLGLRTTIRTIAGGALDTEIPTEQAVREAIDDIDPSDVSNLDIDGATDIGADLADADLIIVDDGAGGTNRKSALSRVWTYIQNKIIALTDVSSHGWVTDEDDLASDDNTKVPTQQSVKAYVDNYKLDDLATPDDNTDLDATTSQHGLLPKLGGGTSNFLRADGTWAAPPGAAGGEVNTASSVGTGVSVFSAKNALDLEFHGILGATNGGIGAALVSEDVSLSLDIDGMTDIGADITDSDTFPMDDGDGGTNRKTAATRIKAYVNEINVSSYAANQTLTTGECKGYIVYVTAACTITLPAIAAGMNVTIITIGDVAVSVDPNASDLIYLDGTALDDGDKITNLSTAGDIAVLTYYDGTGWHASTNGWTDGGA